MNLLNGRRVKMNLVGLDGNAFNLMGVFDRNAKSQGFSKIEIGMVLDECTKGDYNHLLCTLIDHTESNDDDDGYDE